MDEESGPSCLKPIHENTKASTSKTAAATKLVRRTNTYEDASPLFFDDDVSNDSSPQQQGLSFETSHRFVIDTNTSSNRRFPLSTTPPPVDCQVSESHSMSSASRMFDRDGKGYLDSTERALRQLDTDDDGMLTIHNVYDLMRSLQEAQKLSHELMETLQREQKTSLNLKKAVIALAVFAFLLSLSNFAISFAVAKLAKDTEVSSTSHDLVAVGTNQRVGTTSKITEIHMEPLTHEDRRRLREGLDYCSDIQTEIVNNTQQTYRICEEQGKFFFSDAYDLYLKFCPSAELPLGQGPCPSMDGGVDKVFLLCQGKANIIFGGEAFPAQGVAVLDNPGYGQYAFFPATYNPVEPWLPYLYQAEQVVNDPGGLCNQAYEVQIVCPLGPEGHHCIVFSIMDGSNTCETYDPQINPDNTLLLCGGGGVGTDEEF